MHFLLVSLTSCIGALLFGSGMSNNLPKSFLQVAPNGMVAVASHNKNLTASNSLESAFASGALLVHAHEHSFDPAAFPEDVKRWQTQGRIDAGLSMSLLHPKIEGLYCKENVWWLFDASHCDLVAAAWGDLSSDRARTKHAVDDEPGKFIAKIIDVRHHGNADFGFSGGPVLAPSTHQKAAEHSLNEQQKEYVLWINKQQCDWDCIAKKILQGRETYLAARRLLKEERKDEEYAEYVKDEEFAEYVLTCQIEALRGVAYTDASQEETATEIYREVLKLMPSMQLVKLIVGTENKDSEIQVIGSTDPA